MDGTFLIIGVVAITAVLITAGVVAFSVLRTLGTQVKALAEAETRRELMADALEGRLDEMANAQRRLADRVEEITVVQRQAAAAVTAAGETHARTIERLAGRLGERLTAIDSVVAEILNDGAAQARETAKALAARRAAIETARAAALASDAEPATAGTLAPGPEAARPALAGLLAAALPADGFELDVELPGGGHADALIDLPGEARPVALDASLSPELFSRCRRAGEDAAALSELKRELLAHVLIARERCLSADSTAGVAIVLLPDDGAHALLMSALPDVVAIAERVQVRFAGPSVFAARLQAVRASWRERKLSEALTRLREEAEALSGLVGGMAERQSRFEQRLSEQAGAIGAIEAEAADYAPAEPEAETEAPPFAAERPDPLAEPDSPPAPRDGTAELIARFRTG